MKRNPHPDLVRAALRRWRTRLIRACNEVVRLEKLLVRVEKKRAGAPRKPVRRTRAKEAILSIPWRPEP